MKNKNIKNLVVIAMLSAIATILMYIDFPIAISPSFMKLDFAELPVKISAFTLGPVSGVLIAIVKILLKIVIKGSNTMFVGEVANLIGSICYVLPASIIYSKHKTKKTALQGMCIGTLITSVVCTISNYLFLFPTYMKLYGMSEESIIAMCRAINPYIDNMFKVMLLSVFPFNIIKYVFVSIVTYILYKNISRFIKSI